MSIYQALQENAVKMEEDTRKYLEFVLKAETKKERKKLYYQLRESYWKEQEAAQLLALLKLSFNGIWQPMKSRDYMFGTSAGLLNQKNAEEVIEKMDLTSWREALSKTVINSKNYQELEFEAEGALVFVDPPYRDSFTSYGTIFGDKEQQEVVEWCKNLAKNGATVLFTNRCVEGDLFFEELMPEAEFHYFDVVYQIARENGGCFRPADESATGFTSSAPVS